MKSASAGEAAASLQSLLDEVGDGPVIITRDGRPVAALVSIEDEDLDRFVLAHTPRFRRLLEESYESIKRDGGLGEEEFWNLMDARDRNADHKPASPSGGRA